MAPTFPTGLPAHAQTLCPGQHPGPSPRLSAPCLFVHIAATSSDLNRNVLKMPKQRGGGRRLWICAFPTGVFHLHASSAGRETEALCRKGVRCPGSQQQPTPDACSLRVHALRIGSLPPRRPKTPLQADSFLAVSSLEGMTRNYKKSFQKKTTVQPFIKPAETLIHQFSDLPSPHGADLATGPPPLVLLPPPSVGVKHTTDGRVVGEGYKSTS